MATISIRQLHERTGEWVRRAAEHGEITVTDRGKPVAVIQAAPPAPVGNPFLNRRFLPGAEELINRPLGGMTSDKIISQDRNRECEWE